MDVRFQVDSLVKTLTIKKQFISIELEKFRTQNPRLTQSAVDKKQELFNNLIYSLSNIEITDPKSQSMINSSIFTLENISLLHYLFFEGELEKHTLAVINQLDEIDNSSNEVIEIVELNMHIQSAFALIKTMDKILAVINNPDFELANYLELSLQA